MNREQAITIINDLFPVDAPYEDTAAKGRELLAQAKIHVTHASWKNEPNEVLFEYARLCIAEDNRQTNKAKH